MGKKHQSSSEEEFDDDESSVSSGEEDQREYEEECMICENGGHLLLCDGPNCTRVCHTSCAGLKKDPEGQWYCSECRDKWACKECGSHNCKKPGAGPYASEQWALCGKCKSPYHIACAVPCLADEVPNPWWCIYCDDGSLGLVEKVLACKHAPAGTRTAMLATPMPGAPNGSKSPIKKKKAAKLKGQNSSKNDDNPKMLYIKFRNHSHWHDVWLPSDLVDRIAKGILRSFYRKYEDYEDITEPSLYTSENVYHGVQKDWLVPDRIMEIDEDNYGRYRALIKFKSLTAEHAEWEYIDEMIHRYPVQGKNVLEQFYLMNDITRANLGTKKTDKLLIERRRKEIEETVKSSAFTKLDSQPASLNTRAGTLYDYQLEGVNWLRYTYQRRQNVILADEMGLGKTIQVVAFLSCLVQDGGRGPFLVVVPLSTLANWKREFETWAPHLNVVEYTGSAECRTLIRQCEFFVKPELLNQPPPAGIDSILNPEESGKKRAKSVPKADDDDELIQKKKRRKPKAVVSDDDTDDERKKSKKSSKVVLDDGDDDDAPIKPKPKPKPKPKRNVQKQADDDGIEMKSGRKKSKVSDSVPSSSDSEAHDDDDDVHDDDDAADTDDEPLEHEHDDDGDQVKSKKKASKSRTSTPGVRADKYIRFHVLLTTYEMVLTDIQHLTPLPWEVLVVDEAHRLKNAQAKLYTVLDRLTTLYRVLLTGTPLQNSLDELFALLHFLDAKEFPLENALAERFAVLTHNDQVRALHSMLRPLLLRRMKNDVFTAIPKKKENIVRVDLTQTQKGFYKNFEALRKAYKGSKNVSSLLNLVMELKKICNHPRLMDKSHGEDIAPTSVEELVKPCGKMQLLDTMLRQLKERVFSQMINMLDIIEDYLLMMDYSYERIDGQITGADRQIRIDRFNNNSKNVMECSRSFIVRSYCMTVIGIRMRTFKRFHDAIELDRATIEESILMRSKKKLCLEHVVVRRLGSSKKRSKQSDGTLTKLAPEEMTAEELDAILRFGTAQLFQDYKKQQDNKKAAEIKTEEPAKSTELPSDSKPSVVEQPKPVEQSKPAVEQPTVVDGSKPVDDSKPVDGEVKPDQDEDGEVDDEQQAEGEVDDKDKSETKTKKEKQISSVYEYTPDFESKTAIMYDEAAVAELLNREAEDEVDDDDVETDPFKSELLSAFKVAHYDEVEMPKIEEEQPAPPPPVDDDTRNKPVDVDATGQPTAPANPDANANQPNEQGDQAVVDMDPAFWEKLLGDDWSKIQEEETRILTETLGKGKRAKTMSFNRFFDGGKIEEDDDENVVDGDEDDYSSEGSDDSSESEFAEGDLVEEGERRHRPAMPSQSQIQQTQGQGQTQQQQQNQQLHRFVPSNVKQMHANDVQYRAMVQTQYMAALEKSMKSNENVDAHANAEQFQKAYQEFLARSLAASNPSAQALTNLLHGRHASGETFMSQALASQMMMAQGRVMPVTPQPVTTQSEQRRDDDVKIRYRSAMAAPTSTLYVAPFDMSKWEPFITLTVNLHTSPNVTLTVVDRFSKPPRKPAVTIVNPKNRLTPTADTQRHILWSTIYRRLRQYGASPMLWLTLAPERSFLNSTAAQVHRAVQFALHYLYYDVVQLNQIQANAEKANEFTVRPSPLGQLMEGVLKESSEWKQDPTLAPNSVPSVIDPQINYDVISIALDDVCIIQSAEKSEYKKAIFCMSLICRKLAVLFNDPHLDNVIQILISSNKKLALQSLVNSLPIDNDKYIVHDDDPSYTTLLSSPHTDGSAAWNNRHDALVLLGLLRHGYGNADSIDQDDDIDLSAQVYSDLRAAGYTGPIRAPMRVEFLKRRARVLNEALAREEMRTRYHGVTNDVNGARLPGL